MRNVSGRSGRWTSFDSPEVVYSVDKTIRIRGVLNHAGWQLNYERWSLSAAPMRVRTFRVEVQVMTDKMVGTLKLPTMVFATGTP